jgi:hypothetical protein
VEDPPFIVVKNDTGGLLPSTEWHGWIISILQELKSSLDFTYDLQLPSGENTGAYGAADKDLQKGVNRSGLLRRWASWPNRSDTGIKKTIHADDVSKFTDEPQLIVSGAYITPSRLNGSEMTVPYSFQPLALLVRARPAEWHHKAFSFLAPFSTFLWCLLVVVTATAAFIYLLLEGAHKGNTEFHGHAFESGRAFSKSMLSGFYVAFVTSIGMESFKPKTFEGKCFAISWQSFLVLIVAAYTAKLAAFLASNTPILAPASLEPFFDGTKTACVLANSAYAKYLTNSGKYGIIRQHHVASTSTNTSTGVEGKSALFNMAKALDEGECDGIIERKMHLDYVAKGGFDEYQEFTVSFFFIAHHINS